MTEKMKITGLNIDCLESVFEYLEFGDLLNVASSNKRLNKAANFVINRNPWHKSVHFKNIILSRNRLFEIKENKMTKDVPINYITIGDLKTSLQFIRCFGHSVFFMDFTLSNQRSELDQHVINYINEFCSDSLIHITIKNGLKGWERLTKPFSKVITVKVDSCSVVNKDSLNKLFPKMETLWYFCEIKFKKSFFTNANHFPGLKHLQIFDRMLGKSVLCGETITPILRLNPQLVYLGLSSPRYHFGSRNFWNAIGDLKNLETFFLDLKTLPTMLFDNVICLNSVESFTIRINSDGLTKIPFLFGELNTLTFEGQTPSFKDQLNVEFFNFINKHPTIQNLNLTVDSLSVIDLKKIAKSLPSLVSVDFWRCKISANEAINFMTKFQNLKSFEFRIKDTSAYDDFQAQLSNEWECKIDNYGEVNVERFSERIAPKAKKSKMY